MSQEDNPIIKVLGILYKSFRMFYKEKKMGQLTEEPHLFQQQR